MRNGLTLIVLCFSLSLHATEIKIAAAADLKFALDEINERFMKQNPGEKVSVVYGSSGKFVAQIVAGAPFDLFFSADTEKVAALVRAKRTGGEVFAYARGRLVLWVRKDSPLKLEANLAGLDREEVGKIAVANPVTAPFGQAAEAALKKAGLFEKVRSKLVTGENVAQTAQFVASGAADVGLIAKSLALAPAFKKTGRSQDIETSLYPPIAQAGVVLAGPNVAAALKFKKFFLGEGRTILNAYGLSP